ncbi:MAG: hypothetical protein R3C03_11980 [Pirellulaceae bacterium]
MTRIGILIFAAFAAIQFGGATVSFAQIVSTTEGASEQEIALRFVDYERRLNAILKTRRDEEKQFVAAVLLLVKNGDLEEKLIETSYKWVMNKRPDTKYPFVYFERVLRLQAQKEGLSIPEFDYAIYKTKVVRTP